MDYDRRTVGSAKPRTIELPGFADEVSWRALSKRGVRFPFAGNNNPHIEQTPVADSENEAFADGKKLAAEYVKSHSPGGMAEVVAILSWPEQEAFCAIVNEYYSGS